MIAEFIRRIAQYWRHQRWPSSGTVVVAVASLIGLVGFGYPFLLPAIDRDGSSAHGADAPLVFALVTALCLLAIVVELGEHGNARRAPAKTVALLGVLVALDASLRLAPSFLGASPIFPLIILVGAVFGPSFGFQMGALTLLVSALITGGIGPWLPYEMLGAGWVGLTAGWLPRPGSMRQRLLVIALFGMAWGFLYGALLNLYFWPYAAPGLNVSGAIYCTPNLSASETIAHYARFYLTTSLAFDIFRAAANGVLLLALGGPVLRVLDRFHRRFAWEPWESMDAWQPAASPETIIPAR
jgi:energy-coupling factor transport system substrate-specific component